MSKGALLMIAVIGGLWLYSKRYGAGQGASAKVQGTATAEPIDPNGWVSNWGFK